MPELEELTAKCSAGEVSRTQDDSKGRFPKYVISTFAAYVEASLGSGALGRKA